MKRYLSGMFVAMVVLCVGCTFGAAPAPTGGGSDGAGLLALQAPAVKPDTHQPLVYISDWDDGMVAIFGRAGHQIGQIFMTGPQGLDVDQNGSLYVADSLNNVYIFPYGKELPSRTMINPHNSSYLALCPNGKLYVSNFGTGDITIFGRLGSKPVGRLVDPDATDMNWIACDARGDVFVTASGSSGQARIDVYVGGKQSGLRTTGITAIQPSGIKPYSPNNEVGHVLVGDSGTNKITEWDCSKYPCTVTGNQIPFMSDSGLYSIAVTRDSKTVMAVESAYSQGVSYSFPSGKQLFTYYVYSYSSLALVVDAAYSPGRYRP